MNDNFNPNWENNTKIPYFRRCVIQNFPFIEKDFDAVTDYQLLSKVVEYLNKVIEQQNITNDNTNELYRVYKELKNYVLHYFDNLDVQNEINNKIDSMVESGQFEVLFAKYVDAYEVRTNEKIDELNTKVDAIVDIAPTIVSSTSSMTDTDKIYVLTTDNKWYYYNGTQFVAGGTYNSDVTEEEIKWYLDLISTNGNNLFNPLAAIVGALSSSDGSVNTSNTAYWVTDFIEINPVTVPLVSNYYRMFAVAYNGNPVNIYKYCIYDSNKELISYTSPNNSYVRRYEPDTPDFEDYAYIRIQFAQSVLPFENRNGLLLVKDRDTVEFANSSKYKSITSDNIKNSSIENTRLAENLYMNNVISMLENSIMPFNKSDIGYGTIETASGFPTVNNQRLHTTKLIKVPGGTAFNFDNDWTALAFRYREDGTYLGRIVATWSASIYIPTDMYIKFAFQNTVLITLNDINSINNLLSNISISKYSAGYDYLGEKVSLRNKYNVYDTGLTIVGQDSACYDSKMITFSSNGNYKVYSMEGDLLKNTTSLDQVATYTPHANSACFGTEKYSLSDNFPLFYINAYNAPGLPKGSCYVYRLLNDYTNTLEQQIIIDFTNDPIWAGNGTNVRPYGNFLVDTDNNKLYAFTMIDSLHVTRFFKFNLPTLNDGSIVHLTESDIIEYFDVEWFYYLQGCCYYNGKIYASCGFSEADCKLYVVDLYTKQITSILPLGGFIAEPETVITNNDTLYIAGNAKNLYKITF